MEIRIDLIWHPIEFADVFLRQPIPPAERDLILGEAIPREYAADFWEGTTRAFISVIEPSEILLFLL
jgi:hypothetical protein